MARLFISHSSRNNDTAIEVRDWLAANGWEDVFLDLDPKRGIVAGQRWKEELQKAASRCEVVLALVSPEWLASGWCKSEINAAVLMGKKIIVALTGVDKSQVPLDLTDTQFIDLTGDAQAWVRLKEGLNHAGLDPVNFPFEAGRRPYPGFAHFEEQDAAVFFGRDAQIVRGIDEIRRLVRAGVSRMLVILGASGSGKSSFLRAGLWPRLKRDDRAWLPLPIIRPERAVISGQYGLAQALQHVMGEARFADEVRRHGLPRSRADIQDFVERTEDGLVKLLDALRDIGQVPALSGDTTPPPTIVLAIDQGEELFNEEGRDEARRFVDILTRTAAADPRMLAILSMRSDSFAFVQNDPALAALPKETFPLDMMLEGSYREVIVGPARLVEPPLRIDPQLTDALLEDISGQDALPLLAFTLAHLYDNYRADNELTLAGYDKLGRVKGVIDTVVRKAFAECVARGEVEKDENAQLALARAAFIPHLARINAAGQVLRRVATRDEIPANARPLIDSFAEQRLLFRDRQKDAEVVEVAHEALLRQPPVSDLLEEDREFLIGKQQLEDELRNWREAPAADKQSALLTGLKLSRVRAWLAERPQDLTQERDFVETSIQQADADERRTARRRRVITLASIAAAVVMACLAGFAFFYEEHARASDERVHETDENARTDAKARDTLVAKAAREEFRKGDALKAAQIALRNFPSGAEKLPVVPETFGALIESFNEQRLLRIFAESPGKKEPQQDTAFKRQVAFSSNGKEVMATSFDNTVRVFDVASGKETVVPGGDDCHIEFAAISDDGHILTACADKEGRPRLRLWDTVSGQLVAAPEGHRGVVRSVEASHHDELFITSSDDKTVTTWDGRTGAKGLVFSGSPAPLTYAILDDTGDHVAALQKKDGSKNSEIALLWDTKKRDRPIELRGHAQSIIAISFSPDGTKVVTASDDKTASLWDTATARRIALLRGHEAEVVSAVFNADGSRVLTASKDKTAKLWDVATGRVIATLAGHEKPLIDAIFTADAALVVTVAEDGFRVWDASSGAEYTDLHEHVFELSSAIVSPNGEFLVTVSKDQKLRLWPLHEKNKAVSLVGHNGVINQIVFAHDGRRVATASMDTTARLWNAETGKQLVVFRGHQGSVESIVFNSDDTRVLTASTDGTICLWDATTGEKITSFESSGAPAIAAVWSNDGKRVLATYKDSFRLWDAISGQLVANLKRPDANAPERLDTNTTAAFNAAGTRILTVGKNADLWDGYTGKHLRELKLQAHDQPDDGTKSLAFFMPGGDQVVTARGKHAALWNGETGEQLTSAPDAGGMISGIALRSDGLGIVLTLETNLASVWDLNTQKLIPLEGHNLPVANAEFSSDGKRIVTASNDETVRLWEGTTGEPIAVLRGKKSAIGSVIAFSPEGERVAFATDDDVGHVLWTGKSSDEFIKEARNTLPDMSPKDEGSAVVQTKRRPPLTDSKLPYGPGEGMVVTVVSEENDEKLDTEEAVIRTKHTQDDATSLCLEHKNKDPQCINKALSEKLNDRVTGNCKTGEFFDFYGHKYRFEGKRGGYTVVDLTSHTEAERSDEVADGSEASGYPVYAQIFGALCPSAFSDVTDSGEPDVSTAKAGPGRVHGPQRNTHEASHGKIPALTGDTTAQLNQQELGRHRSVAETQGNGVLGFLRSLFR